MRNACSFRIFSTFRLLPVKMHKKYAERKVKNPGYNFSGCQISFGGSIDKLIKRNAKKQFTVDLKI